MGLCEGNGRGMPAEGSQRNYSSGLRKCKANEVKRSGSEGGWTDDNAGEMLESKREWGKVMEGRADTNLSKLIVNGKHRAG